MRAGDGLGLTLDLGLNRHFDRQLAALFRPQQRLIGVTALDIADGEIKAIGSIANPDKLRHLGPIGNLGWVIRSER
jgi:hypothetical protein